MLEVRDGLQGGHSRLLDLVRLASHGQPLDERYHPALLFAWRLLGEPLTVWTGLADVADTLRTAPED